MAIASVLNWLVMIFGTLLALALLIGLVLALMQEDGTRYWCNGHWGNAAEFYRLNPPKTADMVHGRVWFENEDGTRRYVR